MKKFIYSAVAAGALAFGGAASAQDIIGNVLGQILGNVGIGSSGGIPAVVAPGTGSYPYGTVYTDQYGRRVQVDQYGRHVVIEQNAGVYGNSGTYGSYGNGTYGSYGGSRTVYDSYGRPIALDQYNTYRDAYGNRIQVDAYGRHIRLDQYGSYRDQYGRTVYLDANRQPVFIEHNGQLMAASSATVAQGGRRGDRDGDGVRNRDDRYPDDPRWY